MNGISKVLNRLVTAAVIAVVSFSGLSSPRANAQPAAGSGLPTVRAPLKRKTIGLVLGGGSALGFAHIGVLEVLEANRIPIDFIAGTSAGSLIGGFYAAGMSPAEMRALIREQDWYEALRAEAAYRDLSFRRKEDRKDYPTRLSIGLRGGIPRIPGGLDPAGSIGLLLSRQLLPYSPIGPGGPLHTFDDLVVPFRAVAADLQTGTIDVPSTGSLPLALRASMAVPTVFTPVIVNRAGGGQKTLVDGGILDNVPTDVARSTFKPDVVVAVKVTGLPGGKGEFDNLFSVFGQTLNLLTENQFRAETIRANILIQPALADFSPVDFDRVDALADRGRQAALDQLGALKQYQLSEADWADYVKQRAARRRVDVPVPQFIAVETVRLLSGSARSREDSNAEQEIKQRLRSFVGKPLQMSDRRRLDAQLSRIAGEQRYNSFLYEMTREKDQYGLLIRGHATSYGPPYVVVAPDFRVSDANDTIINLRARYSALDVGGYGSELRVDAGIGSENQAYGEYYRRVSGNWFVAPHLGYGVSNRNLFQDRIQTATYRYEQYGVGIDLAYAVSTDSELRLGYSIGRQNYSRRVGAPGLPTESGETSSVGLRWVMDQQDNAAIPRHGVRVEGRSEYVLHSPGAPDGYPRLQGRISQFLPVTRRQTIYGVFDAGTSFGETVPSLEQFVLGGPFRLSAYQEAELQGSSYIYGSLGYLYQVHNLPALLGGRVYAAAIYEGGSAFGKAQPGHYLNSVSLGILGETALGPVFIGGSFGENGHHVFTLALGRIF